MPSAPKLITDPNEKEAIVAEYLAKRELEERQRKHERWFSVMTWIPAVLVAILYFGMLIVLHESPSPYIALAAAAGYLVFDAQRRIARLEKKLDQVLEQLKRANQGSTDV